MNQPLVVVWRVTERCNLGCAFCAFDRNLERRREVVKLAEVLRFVDLLGDLSERSGRRVLVSWLGGEPMIWPGLLEATAHARRRGLSVSLTTNGVALGAERWREFALGNLAELTISVDGLAEVHDRFRGQPGQHAQLLASLKALSHARDERRAGLTLKVNTILLRENVEAFEGLCDALVESGADALTFNQLGGNDRPEFHAAHHPSAEQVERFAAELPELQRRFAERGLAIAGDAAYLHRIRSTSRGLRIAVDECHPGSTFWFIDAQGALSPCSFTSEGYGVPIAALATVDDLLAVPGTLRARRAANKHAACGDCHSTQVFAKFSAPSIAGR